ncbi:MAG: cyclic nucleotide-binding domain-containing protein [Planctomycetota bacterium]|jgi:CRP-like cAMP-binding protein/flavin-dependent dehydrogenase
MKPQTDLKLRDGARVGVIGGGPAGSFFGYFLCQMAERVGLDLQVDLYEPREYACPGPKGCNMCGGIVSESLMQNLSTEGIHLPSSVILRRIDSYFLHMDVGSVRIATPLQEMRIAAVARGSGPAGLPEPQDSFDAFLLDLAKKRGVRQVQERVAEVGIDNELPRLRTTKGTEASYDLLVSAVGVNSPLLKNLEGLRNYTPPKRTKAYVAEFHLGEAMIERYLGNAMHVFLLNLKRLDFAALIPKSDFVTLCLLGDGIDKSLVDAFLASKEVKEVLPPHWELPKKHCHCSPHLSVSSAVQPFGDRVVFVGDCGTTRLFKDGIGAAFRTAKAAAKTAVFGGIAADDFQRSFWPTCKTIHADNRLGKIVFGITTQIQKRRYARRGLWRMTSREQKLRGDKRRMSMVLWDTFTGSAPYKSVFMRSMHPAFLGRLTWEMAAGLRSGESIRPRERFTMATGVTALTAFRHPKGKVLYSEGDRSDCMYVIQGGQAEVIRREDGEEFCVEVLSDGDFFGEMALFRQKVRTETVRAREDVFVYKLEREELLRRIHEDPPMAFRLIDKMAHRIAGLERGLIRYAHLPAAAWDVTAAPPSEASKTEDPLDLTGEVGGLMGRKLAAGEVIYHQGDRGDCMYVIRGGRVEVVRREVEQEVRLAILGDGDFFGEMALFDEEIRPATVRALEDVYIFTLERNALLRRVHEDPSMAFRLIENMSSRIATLEDVLIRCARLQTM